MKDIAMLALGIGIGYYIASLKFKTKPVVVTT